MAAPNWRSAALLPHSADEVNLPAIGARDSVALPWLRVAVPVFARTDRPGQNRRQFVVDHQTDVRSKVRLSLADWSR